MTHNFAIDPNRISNFPGKVYWSCKNCDSGVLIPKGYTQNQVNQFMESKMPCLPAIDTPKDDIIDNRTTILKKEPSTYDRVSAQLRKEKMRKQ